jgi:hypothetical protein
VAIIFRKSLARGINCRATKLIGKVAGSSPAHGLSLLVGDEDAIHKHGYSFCRLFLYIGASTPQRSYQAVFRIVRPRLDIVSNPPPCEFSITGTHVLPMIFIENMSRLLVWRSEWRDSSYRERDNMEFK